MAIDAPQTHYAAAEKNVHVAYQVFGGGTHDLVFVPPFVSNVDVWWELPRAARFFKGLASFARVILLDKRGTGLSDRLSTVETPEERVDDIRAVMDAVGCKKAAIFGASEAVPIAIISRQHTLSARRRSCCGAGWRGGVRHRITHGP